MSNMLHPSFQILLLFLLKIVSLQDQDYVLAPYLSGLKDLEAVDLSADSDVVAMVFM